LAAGEKFGTLEAVKTVSDLYMPVSGKVLLVNTALEVAPETVNKYPYNEGWMIRVKLTNPIELNGLLSASDYEDFINA